MIALAPNRRRLAALAVALVAALLAAAALTQLLRRSWPFSGREPVAAPHAVAAGAGPHEGHGAAPQGHGVPEGYAPVQVDAARLDALALTVAEVQERALVKPLRTVGVVTLDETRTAHVHPKVRGWIERISVDFVGEAVRAGEVLCSIYSQEVYAAELELLAVLDGGGPLLAAARRRLALWDVPRSEVARLERTREARRTFPLLAPRAGTVIAKQAIEGMYVDPSTELYTLSDLSVLWVQADVYEDDVSAVGLGDVATLRVAGLSQPVEAKAVFLAPTLDEATRTRKVRFELQNPKGRLLPGAFVDVALELQLGRGLAVPESAVLRTGERAIVFVAHGEPPTHFEPREVQLGPRVGDAFQVAGGLHEGERVATGAQFLLDSESRLRASSRPEGGHGGH